MQETSEARLFGGYSPEVVRENKGGGGRDQADSRLASRRGRPRCEAEGKYSIDETRWLRCGEWSVGQRIVGNRVMDLCDGHIASDLVQVRS